MVFRAKWLAAIVSIVALAMASPSFAQTEAAGADSPQTELSANERIQGAIRLPAAASAARSAGVESEEVETALDAMRDRGVTPAEATDALEEETEAAEDHGPVDNFGAFVQDRLDEGLRGQELSAAIRAEHESQRRARRRERANAGEREGSGRRARGDGQAGERVGSGRGAQGGPTTRPHREGQPIRRPSGDRDISRSRRPAQMDRQRLREERQQRGNRGGRSNSAAGAGDRQDDQTNASDEEPSPDAPDEASDNDRSDREEGTGQPSQGRGNSEGRGRSGR